MNLKNGLYKIGFAFSVVTSSVLTFELILMYNYGVMLVNNYFRKVFSVVVMMRVSALKCGGVPVAVLVSDL